MPPGPGFLPTFLYYFTGTSLIVALIVAQQLGVSLATRTPYQIGASLGLLAGLLGAYFNRSQLISVNITNPKAFTQKLTQMLNSAGYQETGKAEEFTVYERSGASGVFSGKIFVQIEKKSATIAGRASKVEMLRKSLEAGE